jgi:hypothetical protein
MTVLAARLAGHGYTAYHPASGVVAVVFWVILDVSFIGEYGVSAAVWGITLAYAAARRGSGSRAR